MMTSHTTEIELIVKMTVHHAGGTTGGLILSSSFVQDVKKALTPAACALGGDSVFVDAPEVEIVEVFTVPNK